MSSWREAISMVTALTWRPALKLWPSPEASAYPAASMTRSGASSIAFTQLIGDPERIRTSDSHYEVGCQASPIDEARAGLSPWPLTWEQRSVAQLDVRCAEAYRASGQSV